MTAKERKSSLQEAIKNLDYEKGNVRKLATQMTSVLLTHGCGKNPYKLAWDIAKAVGNEHGAKFGPKDVTKIMDTQFAKELAQKPEYDEEYFREQGIKGAESLTHEERVMYGHQGAESLTHISDES